MGAKTVFAKVIANWDNRENTNNYQHHRPHHLIVFEGDSKEAPNRAKINYGNDPAKNACALAMAQAIQRERTYVFTLETGEKEGHPWQAIREVRDPQGNLVGTAEPPEEGQVPYEEAPAPPPVAPAPVPPRAVRPPVAQAVASGYVGAPLAPAPVVPPPAPAVPVQAVVPPAPAKPANGKPGPTDIKRRLTERTAEFWTEKDIVERLRVTRGASFNAACHFVASISQQFVQFDEHGQVVLAFLPAQVELVGKVCDAYTDLLRAKHDQDLSSRFMDLLNECQDAADVGLLMQHARDLLPDAVYAGLRDVAVQVRDNIKAGKIPPGRY